MALFKIFNNIDSQNSTLPSTYTKGYMYYDAKESIFYIDTAGEGGTTGIRQKINAWGAAKTLKDSLNQQIDTTYIKGISISNNQLSYTTGDGVSHLSTNIIGTNGITISSDDEDELNIGLNLNEAINELEKTDLDLSRNDYIISENGNELNGDVVTFETDEVKPIKKLVVNINPAQATGTPTLETPLPISGWTEANIMRVGTNYFNVQADVSRPVKPSGEQYYHLKPNTFTNGLHYSMTQYYDPNCISNFTRTLSGFSYVTSNPGYGIAYAVRVVAGMKLGVSADAVNGNLTITWVDDTFKLIRIELTGVNGSVFTAPEGATFGIFRFNASAKNTQVSFENVMICISEFPSSYKSYSSITTLPITFPTEVSTVYGGTLTINVNGSVELRTRPYYASYNGEILIGPWVSSMDIYSEGTTPTIGAQVVDLGGAETIYQWTNQQVIKTLYGTNKIWADCGNIIVIVSNNESTYTRKKLDSVFHLLNNQDIIDALGGYTPIASASDDILHGFNSGTAITYTPYTEQQNQLSFDTSTTNPTRTDRLNLNGYLYATKLYSDGKEVLTAHQSLANYKTKQTEVSTATAETTTATTFVYSVTQNENGEITVKTRPLPTYNNYVLPTATTSTKGGVVIGDNINVDTDGKISINSASVTGALGYTPYNSTNPNGYTNNVGTITGIKMNGASKGTSGVVDLGTVITDVSGKLDKSGGTMTGDLTLKGNPTSNLHAATKQYVDNAFTTNDALVFKGTLGTSDDGATVTSLPDTHKQGWTYKVITAGTYAGQSCEIGDTIYCIADGTSANNAHWTIVQTNIDGYVIGPATSTTNGIAIYTGNTGKGLSDSGKTITTTAPASGSVDITIPTSKAVWSAITGASGYGKTGTVTKISTGAGLIGGDITSKGTIKANLNSETSLGTIGTTDKLYAIGVDANGKLAVNVPWENSTYSLSSLGGVGSISASGTAPLTLSASKSGTTVTLTGSIAAATASAAGVAKLGASGGAATYEHTHGLSIVTDSGTNQLTLAANTKYKLTVGGSTYIFTTPPYRGIQNNLTSDSTTESLSAAQGKALANGSARDNTKLPLAGGTMTGNITLSATSGNSPAIIFNRDGTLTDWKVFVTGGKLSFQSSTDNSSYTERGYFKDNSGDFVATSFTGNGSTLTNLNASNISSGTLAQERLPSVTRTNNTSTTTATHGGTFTAIDSITSDTYGRITAINTKTITLPSDNNTDTKVTSVDNHYTPSANTNSELTASLSGTAGSYALNTEYTVLTGVKVQRDAKGHVTGLTYTAQKIKDTNTTYTLAGLMGTTAIGKSSLPVYWNGSQFTTITSYEGKAATAGTADIANSVAWSNISDKPDLITRNEATAYMQKGIDYVTAGQKAETTLGTRATAEGLKTTASGNYSHAEGNSTTASGSYSHAEGYGTVASKQSSHAEGYGTTASGSSSHTEGSYTTASGYYSHAEGHYTTASGYYSHAEGDYTTANHRSQHVFGEYNIVDSSTETATNKGNYIEIVGNGINNNTRSNARTLDWSGNEVLAGKLTVGANPTENMDVATKQYVDNAFITTVKKDGTGATGSWGISITGNAATATAANLTTTTNAIAKYSNTTGTFANSGVTIDASNNIAPSAGNASSIGIETKPWKQIFIYTNSTTDNGLSFSNGSSVLGRIGVNPSGAMALSVPDGQGIHLRPHPTNTNLDFIVNKNEVQLLNIPKINITNGTKSASIVFNSTTNALDFIFA